MTNELPAGEEADLIEYLNHGHKRVTEYLDLVRRWDSIPYDARDPTHPQYSQRVLLLGSYLNWSHTRTWAWDNMQNRWLSFYGVENRSQKLYQYGLTKSPWRS